CDVFLEIGPQPQLVNSGRQYLPDDEVLWLPSVEKGRSPWGRLLETLVALYLRGADVDFRGFERGYSRRVVSLPTYPFQRRRHWFQSPPSDGREMIDARPLAGSHLLLGRKMRSVTKRKEVEFESLIGLQRLPFLEDHLIFGRVLLPSSAYLEMA